MRSAWLLACVLSLAVASSAQPPSLTERMLRAEDARVQTDAEIGALREGLKSADVATRRHAIRAVGRLERPELIALVTPALTDAVAEIRMEAANAVGQLARGSQGLADGQTPLVARAKAETDPRVWGVIAATLGRLPYTTAVEVSRAEAVMATGFPSQDGGSKNPAAVLGTVEGFEALARQSGKIAKLTPATLTGLRAARAMRSGGDVETLARIRRLATLTLTSAGGVDRSLLEAGLADPDAEVRRLTMVAARAEVEGREAIVTKGLADPSPQVRYDAVLTWGRAFQKQSCQPVIDAVRDASPHVSLQAIDLLGNGCPGGGAAASTLQALTEVLTPQTTRWHAPAHALVSLARVAPADARTALPRLVGHGTWQVRMYAARAAGVLAAVETLDRLARDAHHNVREAALGELVAQKRPEAVAAALDALTQRDYQLIITASRALAATSDRQRAVAALVAALARLTAERRDTSRDARVAVLDRLKELGAPDGRVLPNGARATLEPYLTDFDPVIAARAADMLETWLGPATARPRPLLRQPVSIAALDALRGSRLRFVMAGRGAFELSLLVDEAPLTVLRVATRAREGYYNGLTFHRVAPNFVIQGGGPGANEYSGDGPYMRDEVGLLSHRRGTVGISTRGRDTGDAQVFINLVDSPRLDHTYTVFAEVAAGMDVVDAVVEGDVIERVEIVPAPPR
jgi:cyclophilin family peptidyl-prolyl cis-trans isomerase/HEAT repeat protein